MKRYELDKRLDELAEHGGSGTWHISLYIRPDKSVSSVQNRMRQEVSEAESIKSDDTRERVQTSLEKILSVLAEYSETPEHGLVVFTSPQDVYVLDGLPFDCPENRYHCGKEFILDPLKGSLRSEKTYGLIVVERGRASIAVLDGGRITSVNEKESHVMGKTKAGGQSQARFERERERQKHEFFLDVQESAYATFSPYELSGVVIGGTLDTAKEFAKNYTQHDWEILGTYSVDHGDKQGVEELVERAAERILEEDESDIRRTIQTFLRGVRDGSAEYGRESVLTKLERGAVDTLLLSTELSLDEIEQLSVKAEEYGGSVVMVEPCFEEAQMFENMSGGYGALIRW